MKPIEQSHENAIKIADTLFFTRGFFLFSKMTSEDLPECGEKMPVEQSLHALLICRVLQQQQIASIESMAAVEDQNGNVSSL